MATIAQKARTASLFHVCIGLAFIVIAFGGFAQTFWGPLATGTLNADPVIHLHGALPNKIWTASRLPVAF